MKPADRKLKFFDSEFVIRHFSDGEGSFYSRLLVKKDGSQVVALLDHADLCRLGLFLIANSNFTFQDIVKDMKPSADMKRDLSSLWDTIFSSAWAKLSADEQIFLDTLFEEAKED